MADDKEEFSFIKEKIKKQPLNKKKVVLKIFGVIGLAILFGVVSCFTFYLVQPWMVKKFGKKPSSSNIVAFPDETSKEESPETEETQGPQTETVVVQEQVALEAEDYKTLYQNLNQTGKEAQKALVTLESSVGESENRITSGFISYESESDLFIVSDCRAMDNDITKIQVVFGDGSRVEGVKQGVDYNTGIGVIKVPIEAIPEEMKTEIVTDLLNKAVSPELGEPIIAVGNPSGRNSTIQYGFLVSKEGTYDGSKNSNESKGVTYDVEYSLLSTDIEGNGQGSGILLNTQGVMLGFITQKFGESGNNQLVALDATKIRTLIAALSNNPNVAYFGVKGKETQNQTSGVNVEEEVPKGIFVGQVAVNSPASNQGIQNGDIITSINEELVTSDAQFKKLLEAAQPGQTWNVVVKRKGAEGYVDIPYVIELGVREP